MRVQNPPRLVQLLDGALSHLDRGELVEDGGVQRRGFTALVKAQLSEDVVRDAHHRRQDIAWPRGGCTGGVADYPPVEVRVPAITRVPPHATAVRAAVRDGEPAKVFRPKDMPMAATVAPHRLR